MSKALELSKKYKSLLTIYNINTPLRLAHFFAQLDHESGLKPIEENLNYSESGLLKVFPKYFTKATAKAAARKPREIANRVYANRMDNGDYHSGDGWKFRGRGFMQTTGRRNYTLLSKATNIDYVNNPDWLLREPDAMIAALWYWTVNNLNKHADKDNLDAVSDIINIGRLTSRIGDANGYKDRKVKLTKYKKEFKV